MSTRPTKRATAPEPMPSAKPAQAPTPQPTDTEQAERERPPLRSWLGARADEWERGMPMLTERGTHGYTLSRIEAVMGMVAEVMALLNVDETDRAFAPEERDVVLGAEARDRLMLGVEAVARIVADDLADMRDDYAKRAREAVAPAPGPYASRFTDIVRERGEWLARSVRLA